MKYVILEKSRTPGAKDKQKRARRGLGKYYGTEKRAKKWERPTTEQALDIFARMENDPEIHRSSGRGEADIVWNQFKDTKPDYARKILEHWAKDRSKDISIRARRERAREILGEETIGKKLRGQK